MRRFSHEVVRAHSLGREPQVGEPSSWQAPKGNAVKDLFLVIQPCPRGRSRCRQDFGALARWLGPTGMHRILGGSRYENPTRRCPKGRQQFACRTPGCRRFAAYVESCLLSWGSRPRLCAAVAPRLSRLVLSVFVACFVCMGHSLCAHEIRPALLDINERESGFFDVQWKVPALGQMSLPIQPVFPECMKPVGPPSAHAAPGAILQYSSFKTDGAPIAGETILIDGLTGVQIDVLLRIKLANGDSHSVILRPKSPSFVIPERASKGAVSWSYLKMGVEHIGHPMPSNVKFGN